MTKVSNMPEMSDDLTSWNYDKNMTVPFLAMVFDQCTDSICDQTGKLSLPPSLPPFFPPLYGLAPFDI